MRNLIRLRRLLRSVARYSYRHEIARGRASVGALLLLCCSLVACGGLPPIDPSAASFGTSCTGLSDATTCGAGNICIEVQHTDASFREVYWTDVMCSRPCGAGCPAGSYCAASGVCYRTCNDDSDCAPSSVCRVQAGYKMGCVPR